MGWNSISFVKNVKLRKDSYFSQHLFQQITRSYYLKSLRLTLMVLRSVFTVGACRRQDANFSAHNWNHSYKITLYNTGKNLVIETYFDIRSHPIANFLAIFSLKVIISRQPSTWNLDFQFCFVHPQKYPKILN